MRNTTSKSAQQATDEVITRGDKFLKVFFFLVKSVFFIIYYFFSIILKKILLFFYPRINFLAVI